MRPARASDVLAGSVLDVMVGDTIRDDDAKLTPTPAATGSPTGSAAAAPEGTAVTIASVRGVTATTGADRSLVRDPRSNGAAEVVEGSTPVASNSTITSRISAESI